MSSERQRARTGAAAVCGKRAHERVAGTIISGLLRKIV
jgi:hypothetical protein